MANENEGNKSTVSSNASQPNFHAMFYFIKDDYYFVLIGKKGFFFKKKQCYLSE